MNGKVYCNGTRIKCLQQMELTVGMVGAEVEFDFSEEWDGLGKLAVFRSDGSRDVIVDENGVAVVPHEILATPGMDVEVGVYAVREDGTTWPAPTPFCKLTRNGIAEGADPSGDESYPPTPEVGEQAVAMAGAALAAAEEAKAMAEGAVKSVNNVKPDENGNVNVAGGNGGGGSGGSAEIPFFNLAEMGLGSVTAGGFWASLTTDTSEIRAALEKWPVKFGLKYNYEGADLYVEMTGGVLYADALGESYQIVQNGVLGDDSIMLSVMVQPDGIGAVANKLLDRLDETLSIEGIPADAKAVGDALAELEAQIPESGGGSGGITEETDPTVPAWAKAATKPTYTATEVGAMAADAPVVKSVNGTAPDASGNVTVAAGGGVSDYTELTNKPKINGVEVSGDKASADYGIGNPTDEQVAASVEAWLDAHPEATTTVADGSITEEKLADKSVTPFKLADGMFDATRTANLINPDEHYMPNSSLRSDGVTIDANAERDVIYKVPVEEGKTYCITPKAVTIEGSTASHCQAYFLDADGNKLSNSTVYVTNYRIMPPAGTAFVSIVIYHQETCDIMLLECSDYKTVDWDTYIPYYAFNLNSGNTVSTEQVVGLGEFVDARTSAFQTKAEADEADGLRFVRVASENLIDPDTHYLPKKRMRTSGVQYDDNADSDIICMVPVEPNTTYCINPFLAASGELGVVQGFRYKADGTFISYANVYPAYNSVETTSETAFVSFNIPHQENGLEGIMLVEVANPNSGWNYIDWDTYIPYKKYSLRKKNVVVPKENVPWIERHVRQSPMFHPAKVNISAHRGDMHDFPENTIPAFASAGKKGVFAIETDARPTSDGVLMCLHDATVDRTTDGTGNLADMTYEQAIALNIDYGSNVSDYADNPLKIPTFAEYLKVCKKYGCVALIHLQQSDEAYISSVYEAVNSMGMAQSAIFVSWSYDDAKAIRALDDEVCVGVAYYGITSDTLTEMEFLGGCIGVHALSKTAITEEVISEAHRRGIYIFASSDDSAEAAAKETLEYWYNLGVDNIVHSYLDASIL